MSMYLSSVIKPIHKQINQAGKVFTVPLINALQIGHLRIAGAQWAQQHKCPHGRKAIVISSSMQI